MIFCPKNEEKLLSALRLHYQKKLITDGIKDRYRKKLRDLSFTEAILLPEIPMPYCIEALSYEILTAVRLKKSFDCYININANYMVDKKLYTLLLLNISRLTDYLEITENNTKILIKGRFKINEKIIALIQKLRGVVFRENKNAYILLTLEKTGKNSEDFPKAYELYRNPLSLVNLYID